MTPDEKEALRVPEPPDPQLTELQSVNRRLSAQLEQAKARTDLLTEAVYQAVRDGLVGFTIPPVPPPPVTANCDVSSKPVPPSVT